MVKVFIMQINKYDNNTNFQANKILSAKTFKEGCENLLEVYKLNRKDEPFIERCLDVCDGKDKFIPDYDKNILENPSPFNTLKDFFKSFLDNAKGNYYIAIKDNSVISGILHTIETNWEKVDYFTGEKSIKINKKLILDADAITNTVLDDTVIKEMKKEIRNITDAYATIPNKVIDYFRLKSKVADKNLSYIAKYTPEIKIKKGKYPALKMKYETNSNAEQMYLKKETPNTNYKSTYEDTNNYDLGEVLGIYAD